MFRHQRHSQAIPPRPGMPPVPGTGFHPGARGNSPGTPEPPARSRVTFRSAANKMRHRGQRGMQPWLVLAAMIPAGAIAHAAPIWGCTGAAAAAAGICLPAWKHYSKRKYARWYAMGCTVLAGLWLAWASLAGLSRATLLGLLGMWVIPWLTWWYSHRIRHGHGKEEEKKEPARPDELLTDLCTRVCGPGGKVAGAGVTELPRIEGGRRFRFSLVRGKQTVSTVLSARPEIASAAGLPLDRVVTEGMPGGTPGERGPEHLAMVTILDARHPQRQIQEFTGPTLDKTTGLFNIGPYPDSATAHGRAFKVDEHQVPIRGASSITAGAQGSGKSRHAEHRILEQMASGVFATILLDGQGGASIPSLTEWVTWPALTPAEWGLCLRSMVRLMIARTALIASKGVGHWDPAWGPFVGISLEEAHRIHAIPANMLAVKAILQEGEKVGMGADPSTQFPSQVELGASSGTAGANALRDLAASGGVYLFRTGGKFAKNVLVGDIEVAPHMLPQEPGWLHPLGVSMRTAPVRRIRAADPASWAPRFSPQRFSPADIEALDGADGAFSARLDRLDEHMAAAARGLSAASIEEQVALLLGETVPGQPTQAERAQKATVASTVWDILSEHGRIKRAALITEVRARGDRDCHESSVDQALAAYERTGHARKTPGEHGVWERVTTLSVVGNGS